MPAVRGGQDVEYQRRKKRNTTNALYLTDRYGSPLTMSAPVAGHHNELYNIEVQLEIVTATLEDAYIQPEGLFLNANAEFDSKEFRKACDLNKLTLMFALTNVTAIQIEINIWIKSYMIKDMLLKKPMLGSVVLDHCLLDLIQLPKAGKDLII